MWEASTGILLILVVSLGLGMLFGPTKKAPRGRSGLDFRIASPGVGDPQVRQTTEAQENQNRAASGAPTANKSSTNIETFTAQGGSRS